MVVRVRVGVGVGVVGVGVRPHVLGNCPSFETKRETPWWKPVKVVCSDLGVKAS